MKRGPKIRRLQWVFDRYRENPFPLFTIRPETEKEAMRFWHDAIRKKRITRQPCDDCWGYLDLKKAISNFEIWENKKLVYAFVDHTATLLYVGQTSMLFHRLHQHSQDRFWPNDTIFILEPVNPYYLSFLEAFFILRYNPKLNIGIPEVEDVKREYAKYRSTILLRRNGHIVVFPANNSVLDLKRE